MAKVKVRPKPRARPLPSVVTRRPGGRRHGGSKVPQLNLDDFEIPDTPRERFDDLSKYCTLIYGRPGIGKTTLAASWPSTMLLSCERISRGLKVRDFNWENGGVTSWSIFRAAVDLLERPESRKKVDTICVDTLDASYSQCMQWVCDLRGIEYPDGEGFGKAWDAVKKEYRTQLGRIQAAGYGLVLISHSREQEITSHSGQKYTRIQPTASGAAYQIAKAITDLTLYAEWLKDKQGSNIRVLITQGDEVVDAKNNIDLPQYLPLKKQGGYNVLLDAFKGKPVGIDSSRLMVSTTTSKPVKELLKAGKQKGN